MPQCPEENNGNCLSSIFSFGLSGGVFPILDYLLREIELLQPSTPLS